MNNPMKKLLFAILCSPLLAMGAASTDLNTGFDPTGSSSVTGAQLLQMINNASPTNGRGFVIRSTSTPDHASNPRMTNYLWLDSSTEPPRIKVYDSSAATWVPQSVTAGSIGTNELAANAVISGKIGPDAIHSTNIIDESIFAQDIAEQNIVTSHLFPGNTVSNMHIATRTIEGGYDGKLALATLTHTNIAAGTIQGFNLAAHTVTSNYVGAASIYGYHLATTNINTDHLRDDAVSTAKLTNGAVTAAKIAENTITTNNLAPSAHQQLVKAWGWVDSGGTLANGYGAGVTRVAQGIYLVTPTVAPGITNYAVVSTALFNTPGTGGRTMMVATNTTTTFTLFAKDNSGAVQDTPFTFQLIY